MFGQQQQQQQPNKTFSFAPSTLQQTPFGGGAAANTSFTFGAGSTTGGAVGAAKPTLFGAQQSLPTGSGTTGFGFGQTGTQSTTTPSLFGGQQQQQQQQSSLGQSTGFSTGFSGFGQPTTTSAGSTFSFNKPATTTTTSPFAFGAGTTGTSAFGGGGGGLTGFGQMQPTTSFGFGSTTTQKPQPLSLFGTTTATAQPQTAFGFGANAQQATTAPAQNLSTSTDLLSNALVYAQSYNDERDLILARWNQLQAFYGTGKIFFQNMAVDIKEDNPLTRFKTVGYSCKPSYKNEDGFVCLLINGTQTTVKSNQQNIIDTLTKIFGSNASLSVTLESIKPLLSDKTEFMFYVVERAQNGQTRRIPSLDVFNFINKSEATGLDALRTTSTIKQQLEKLNVISVYPLVGFNDEQIKQYLASPPQGIDPILWEQAKRNNPNSKKLLPIPIVGFKEMNKRFSLQEQENQAQRSRLHLIADDIEAINSKNKLLQSKIEQYKLKNDELEHRVLKIMINYEIRRKIGVCFEEDEKYLHSVLDSFQIELNSPINKEIQKQKLNEYLDIIQTYEQQQQQQQQSTNKAIEQQKLNQSYLNSIEDIQKSLREQHKAFKSLIEIINKDLNDINLIKKDFKI